MSNILQGKGRGSNINKNQNLLSSEWKEKPLQNNAVRVKGEKNFKQVADELC